MCNSQADQQRFRFRIENRFPRSSEPDQAPLWRRYYAINMDMVQDLHAGTLFRISQNVRITQNQF
jgi:hypothetical protein